MKDIEKQYNEIKQGIYQIKNDRTLINEINKWEEESVQQIRSAAKEARSKAQQLTDESYNQLLQLSNDLATKLQEQKKINNCTDNGIKQCYSLLKDCRDELGKRSEIKIVSNVVQPLCTVQTPKKAVIIKETESFLPVVRNPAENSRNENNGLSMPPANSDFVTSRFQQNSHMSTTSPRQLTTHPGIPFGLNPSTNQKMSKLFEYLQTLPPMDKNGSMSGNCDFETTQMEKFLTKNFDFKNIRKYIVHGVKSFQLGKPPYSMKPNTTIYFPDKTANSFMMSVKEIIDWQDSYRVYADRDVEGMDKKFLQRALQGLSESGSEAFLMKFVVRISQCPILMEFDAKVISRPLEEQWPNLIKLVSVTGIDFAGRIHDIGDICTYVSNWKDVYEIDPKSKLPVVYNGRDFCRRKNGPPAKLDEKLLLDDLMSMARLRLRACDQENVQIVVETGIGLGVFAGRSIGIDETVRKFSALAIRTVLEQDGPSYRNIVGVVFALPVFEVDQRNGQRQDTYYAFVNEFRRDNYQGPIPVLIADQDMHRLTVAIARKGYTVSELNPADSHGVFGEYWQNRGPAVEEKLALTTLGLLVQHHLINPQVLDPNHYQLI
jgi:hypothetical protein